MTPHNMREGPLHVAAEHEQTAFVKVQRIDNPRCADHSDEKTLIARWHWVVAGR